MNIKTINITKETAELSSAHNIKSIITERMFTEINSAAYIKRKNIARQNIFIEKTFRSEDAILAKVITKHLTFNIRINKRKKKN